MEFYIRQTGEESEIKHCAALMAGSEPWITLKRDYNASLKALEGGYKEIYIVTAGDTLIGFAVLQLAGTFKGYIQTICISEEYRGKGIGTKLIQFCEERIFRISPNVFMCVSSFNTKAAELYYSLGYEKIGELKDFIVKGYSEILLRKTIGPIADFLPVENI